MKKKITRRKKKIIIEHPPPKKNILFLDLFNFFWPKKNIFDLKKKFRPPSKKFKRPKNKKNKCIGASIRIGQDIQCVPYAGFLMSNMVYVQNCLMYNMTNTHNFWCQICPISMMLTLSHLCVQCLVCPV